jgi:hypothetical protein
VICNIVYVTLIHLKTLRALVLSGCKKTKKHEGFLLVEGKHCRGCGAQQRVG